MTFQFRDQLGAPVPDPVITLRGRDQLKKEPTRTTPSRPQATSDQTAVRTQSTSAQRVQDAPPTSDIEVHNRDNTITTTAQTNGRM